MNSLVYKIFPSHPLVKGYFSFICALLSLIILPVNVYFLPPLMILWGICWFLENYLRINMIRQTRNAYLVLFILFISYYIWQSVGLIYSEDFKMGLQNLFGRLSLVFFPLVLIYPGETIKNKADKLIKIFALSTFVFILFCFCYAIYRSVSIHEGILTFNPHPANYPWLSYFYSSELTISHHPSYISMYVLLSVCICFEAWFDSSLKYKNRIIWLLVGFMLLISQFFLSSRAGILISLILVPFYFIVMLRKRGKIKYAWIGIILIVIVLLPVVVKNQRMDYLFSRILLKSGDYERKEDPRLIIWRSALKIVQKNMFFGVGIGDVRTELAAEYERIGEKEMAKVRYNTHNQFLEVLLENGIIGVVLFLSIFCCMFYIALSDRNLLYGVFILMILMFFLFETVLYRLAGVSFFTLFSFLLIHINNNNQIV